MNIKNIVALALLAIVVAWMAFPRERGALDDGYGLPERSTDINAVSSEGNITNDNSGFTVRVARLSSQEFVQKVRVRGQTKAFRLVDVRAETSGRVVSTPVPRGARVEQGELLCELAVDNRDAELQEALSRREEAQLEYSAALDLEQRGLQSRVNIAQKKSALDAATASVDRAKLALERTKIKAPFSGILESRDTEVGDLMDIGGTCGRLLDDTPMLLVGLVPEQEVGKLFIGAPVTASLLAGPQVTGKVSYISRAADTSSRSYSIEIELDPTDKEIRQGITAEIFIAASQTMAHLIPPSSLTLNDAGEVGVKLLNANNIVQFAPVNIIGENTSMNPGMWVTGLPNNPVVITHGQEIVFPGQTVSADYSWSSSDGESSL
ncbi:MAG: efflux RND transporter periplasmic adaptor subunit [Pseudohongiellaceae bacterium]|nr:efflux RND transporter periplasmic adaptor subunit [Pseudohongiellaceae bacterium]